MIVIHLLGPQLGALSEFSAPASAAGRSPSEQSVRPALESQPSCSEPAGGRPATALEAAGCEGRHRHSPCSGPSSADGLSVHPCDNLPHVSASKRLTRQLMTNHASLMSIRHIAD